MRIDQALIALALAALTGSAAGAQTITLDLDATEGPARSTTRVS